MSQKCLIEEVVSLFKTKGHPLATDGKLDNYSIVMRTDPYLTEDGRLALFKCMWRSYSECSQVDIVFRLKNKDRQSETMRIARQYNTVNQVHKFIEDQCMLYKVSAKI